MKRDPGMNLMRGLLFGLVLLAAACGHVDHDQNTASTPSAPIAATAPHSHAEVGSVQPASTLQQDAFDAPAPVSVREAAKAREGGHHAAPAVIYACPMHPDVTSDRPGTCPKCGMTLVKKN